MPPYDALNGELERAWNHYLEQERRGDRATLPGALATFLARLSEAPSQIRVAFAEELASRTLDGPGLDVDPIEPGVPLRMTLFAQALLPQLLREYRDSPSPAGRRIAKSKAFFYMNPALVDHLAVDLFDPADFLRAALRADPHDQLAARSLQEALLAKLNLWAHEPGGVLVAPDLYDATYGELIALVARFGPGDISEDGLRELRIIGEAWRDLVESPHGPSFEARLEARGFKVEE